MSPSGQPNWRTRTGPIIRSAVVLPYSPWSNFPGKYPCPECGSNAWTIPWNEIRIHWRCVMCHVSFDVEEEKMDLVTAERITEAMVSNGIECELREDYSGRGMFGATTPALVISNDDLIEMARIAGRIGVKRNEIPGRTDNMGRDRIVVY